MFSSHILFFFINVAIFNNIIKQFNYNLKLGQLLLHRSLLIFLNLNYTKKSKYKKINVICHKDYEFKLYII